MGCIAAALAQFLLFGVTYRSPIVLSCLFSALAGFTGASLLVLLPDLCNEIVEYDTFLTGQGLHREGLYTALREFIPKFVELPGQALPFIVLAHFGYDPDRPSTNCPDNLCQPFGVIYTIRLCISFLPGFFTLVSLY